MPETGEFQSLVHAAEQAAAAGDYASAEQRLREAARLQEASLGPLHPDLANTLNNLGVVCEITKKPVDAEHYFRRACAIATAALEPDHPFVIRSRKNLEDFREARRKAVISRRPSRPLTIGALIAGALFLMFIAAATWFRANDEVEPLPRSVSVSPPGNPATPAGSPAAVVPKTGDTTATTAKGQQVGESSIPPVAKKPSTAASVRPPPAVAVARLCRDLVTSRSRGSSSDWQCTPANLPVGPGLLFFYTRVKSPTDTTVQHRWYRGDRLHHSVRRSIRANATSGYRTYSRYTVNSQGEWRVELRTRDGALLHEERFMVR
jgi:hypothetical protein